MSARRNGNAPDLSLLLRAHQIDVEQAMLQSGGINLQTVGQDEASDKATRRDAAMQEGLLALAGVIAFARDGQLAAFQGDGQFLGRKARNSQADAHRRRPDLLDIIGG